MDHQENTKKTLWHQILGRIFEFLLADLEITILTDVKVMTHPPEADILLLRREHDYWTTEQLERLPDGIRESTARHILIEFKATESISKESFTQASSYDYFYKQSQKLADNELQTFVISAIEPQKANREQFGYHIRCQPGVYQSDNIAFNHITLISLNELPDKLHNAWITCLASKKIKRLKSFNILKYQGFQLIPAPFKWFLTNLRQLISNKGDDDMALELTPQDLNEMVQFWGEELLSTIPLEKRLMGLKPEQRLMGLKPEERLAGLSPEEIENYLKTLKKG
ncbi:hypothetical protein BGP_0818 [Beggiatoa sp. PS]|nr:hypothetical protein BGP_0818 [Beggiatoa sp. PS]